MMEMYAEQFAPTERAAKALLSGEGRAPSAASPYDSEVMQRFADHLAQMAGNLAWELARGWKLLASGRIDNPSKEGRGVGDVVDRVLELTARVEEDWRKLQDQGTLRVDL